MLDRQKAARRDLTIHARELAQACVANVKTVEEAGSGTMDEKEDKTRDVRREKRESFAKQLMYPHWLEDIPCDLHRWYVMPRPEGTRCLVIAFAGTTVSRKTNGSMLHRFSSSLPNGSGPTREKNSHCILDCIYHPENNTYYVMDLMSWKSYNLYDSSSEFRFFWVRSKLAETTVHKTSAHNKYRFLPVPHFDASPEGFLLAYPHEQQFRQEHLTTQALQLQNLLQQAAPNDTDMATAGQQQQQQQQVFLHVGASGGENSGGGGANGDAEKKQKPPVKMAPTLVGKHGFIQDGLLFIHKETHYELGVTPLVLLWKDPHCSRFFLETEDGSTVSQQQVATLGCFKDRTVRCLEGQVLGTLPEAFVTMQGFEDGDLVKMGLEGVDVASERVQAIHFVSRASKSRVLADTWSKIVFQHQARTGTALSAEKLHQVLQQQQQQAPSASSTNSSSSSGNNVENSAASSSCFSFAASSAALDADMGAYAGTAQTFEHKDP